MVGSLVGGVARMKAQTKLSANCTSQCRTKPFTPKQAAAFVFLSVGLEVAVGGWATVYSTKWLQQSEAEGHALTSGACSVGSPLL